MGIGFFLKHFSLDKNCGKCVFRHIVSPKAGSFRYTSPTPAIFRSKKVNGAWGEPELIVSQFAGEPTLDDAGNLYFVHHYFEYGEMIGADIYVVYRK